MGRPRKYVFLTKKIRIPISSILGIRRSQFGPEAVIETDRGLTTVIESYEDVRNYVFGVPYPKLNDNDNN